MKISSRYTVALQLLCIFEIYKDSKITSNFIAEKTCGHAISYEIKPRREGDIATCYCDPQKAKEDLGWVAKYGIDEMCEDSWRWQSSNPDGYATK